MMDNSKLESLIKKDLTDQEQIEFFEIFKTSQLLMPVTYSDNLFEGIENAQAEDIIEVDDHVGFNINYLTYDGGKNAVPLFSSEEILAKTGIETSTMAIYMSDLADMLSQTDKYSLISINPFTPDALNMPIELLFSLFKKHSPREIEIVNEMMELLEKHSHELKQDAMFIIRSDDNYMVENARDGVFVPEIPLGISTNPEFRKDLKYTNILLFDKSKKIFVFGSENKDEFDALVAPGTELILDDVLDEYTSVWKCGAQPFYEGE